MKRLLILLLIALSFMLVHNYHMYRELDKAHQKVQKVRQRVAQELDSLAWQTELNANRQYVLNTDHVFRCDVVIEFIDQNK